MFVFDHLGYGQSDKREGQDLTLAAQGRRFAELLTASPLQSSELVAGHMPRSPPTVRPTLRGVALRPAS